MNSQAKEIRQQFRLLMNGVTAQSLREKGQDYHVNWGASLGHLKTLASEYDKDRDTAMALWQDDVRESKIMATLLMPASVMIQEEAREWIDATHTQEIAEVASMNLYQYLPYAKTLALALIVEDDVMRQLHGYCILSRLLIKGTDFDESEYHNIYECADRVVADETAPLYLRHAAYNTLGKINA